MNISIKTGPTSLLIVLALGICGNAIVSLVGLNDTNSSTIAIGKSLLPGARVVGDLAVLGRLAIDRNWWGKGLGAALLQGAVLRTGQAAHIMGIRGFLLHAIFEEAKAFYEHYGFIPSPANPLTLVMSLKSGAGR
ncbi:GNAT family N-acetyltransferase (plasmid) [Rhizobium sullae]|uniref:GNAT family N-acetyltransferase n=1 Tax=Rhizobium sullae TaxID=50338 RepID=A0ABY5XSY5_RHISU|nr:GNAT family N-acetyltransferase [Rhizobium sullae]UWU17196.1 GNAT family N-acetyltransferase [Rhizobium sullae]